MSDLDLELVIRLAEQLPASDLVALARAAEDGRSGLLALRARTASPIVRDACERLLEGIPEIGGRLSGALAAAGAAFEAALRRQTADVVWTGPESDVDTGRLTAPVVAELIGEAQHELLLVSYASHDEPRIGDALAAAVDRGVDITLVVERPDDNPAFSGSGRAFPGLPARRLSWPLAIRPAGASLHAKLIVVDARTALVGSANLTGRAMVENLECGVLLRGGTHPRAIRDHVFGLFRSGLLTVVDT